MTLRPLGLAQRRALQAIQRLTRPRGPQRSELAAELVVSDGRASRLMHSLRRRGLVEGRPGNETLSAAGKKELGR